MANSGIGYVPAPGTVVLSVPEISETYAEGIAKTPAVMEKERETWVSEGKEMIVAATGDEVKFIKVGNRVVLNSGHRVQWVDVKGTKYWQVQASAIAGILED